MSTDELNMSRSELKNAAKNTVSNITNIVAATTQGSTAMAKTALHEGVGLANNTIGSTTQLANTAVTEGTRLTNDTLIQSMKSANIIQNAANDSIQTAVKTGTKGIQSASNIAIEGTNSAEEIARNGLILAAKASGSTTDIANTGLDTTAHIANTGLQETKNIAQTGLIQLGKVTTTSITAAGTALQALVAVTNNVASRVLDARKARNKSDTITANVLVYESLRESILKDFAFSMKQFIVNFNTMVLNQKKLLSSILNIYQLKNCKPRLFIGYKCNSDIVKNIVKFNKNLNIISRESDSNITLLNSIITEARSNVFNINTINTTPEKYAEDLGNITFKLSTKASEIFTSTLEKFNVFAHSINTDNVTELKNDDVDTVKGGRKKRKTQHKKSRKSRKSIKNYKNRKH